MRAIVRRSAVPSGDGDYHEAHRAVGPACHTRSPCRPVVAKQPASFFNDRSQTRARSRASAAAPVENQSIGSAHERAELRPRNTRCGKAARRNRCCPHGRSSSSAALAGRRIAGARGLRVRNRRAALWPLRAVPGLMHITTTPTTGFPRIVRSSTAAAGTLLAGAAFHPRDVPVTGEAPGEVVDASAKDVDLAAAAARSVPRLATRPPSSAKAARASCREPPGRGARHGQSVPGHAL